MTGETTRRRWPLRYWFAGAALLPVVAILALLSGPIPWVKPFYLPSEAMAPTLLKNDRLLASMQAPASLRRGDVILLRLGDSIYIKRIAALPGDRIAFAKGQVILNGRPVPQQPVGTELVAGYDGEQPATRLREHFPGESGDHYIYDSGPSPEDDLAEQIVAPGHVFVLGDNRDNSADSRVPRAEMGVEQLPIGDIRGTPLFYTWGPSHKFGRAIH
jgi:signal peptidase I